MISKSTLLHLRIPFSFFLMPVFLIAWSIQPLEVEWSRWILTFLALHLLLYPSSNAFNSYFDKDEGSIGGLKNPPKVTKALFHWSQALDIIALLIAYWLSPLMAVLVLLYTLASRSYSHPLIRLKKLPIIGWLTVGFFQGFICVLLVFEGLHAGGLLILLEPEILWPAALSSCMIWAGYPMTQIYQHQEDAKRGDKTLSLLLGIMGTFYFTAAFFTLTVIGFVWYLMTSAGITWSLTYLLVMSPTLVYFLFWFIKTRANEAEANYSNTMRLNWLSACCANIYFTVFSIVQIVMN